MLTCTIDSQTHWGYYQNTGPAPPSATPGQIVQDECVQAVFNKLLKHICVTIYLCLLSVYPHMSTVYITLAFCNGTLDLGWRCFKFVGNSRLLMLILTLCVISSKVGQGKIFIVWHCWDLDQKISTSLVSLAYGETANLALVKGHVWLPAPLKLTNYMYIYIYYMTNKYRIMCVSFRGAGCQILVRLDRVRRPGFPCFLSLW